MSCQPTKACQHKCNEDCMTCIACGICTESLDENDLCPEEEEFEEEDNSNEQTVGEEEVRRQSRPDDTT